MADIINLRHARKSKARSDKDKKAQENRVKFGRSKSEKTLERIDKMRQIKALDGKKRDD